LSVVVAAMLPDVPVMVSVLVPPAAEALAVRVNVLVPVVEVGENEAVTPLCNPAIERFTLPVKPYSGTTVIVAVTVFPGLRVNPFDDGTRAKVGV
jgi:hypothetical protein